MTQPDINLLEAGPERGYGADSTPRLWRRGGDLGPLAELLTPSETLAFCFPGRTGTALPAGGMTLRAWYDLDPEGFEGPAEEIAGAEALALALVQRERSGALPRNASFWAAFPRAV